MSFEKSGIYRIDCIENGGIYVGSSCRIYRRWTDHRRHLRRGTNPCIKLQSAWDKYGESSFVFSIIEECVRKALEDREQYWINRIDPNLNVLKNVTCGLRDLSAARAALITHCPRGHEYTPENTYVGRSGKRICRTCNAERVAKIWASETPEQREARRVNVAQYNERMRDARLARQAIYTASHRQAKAAYDKAHLAEKRARRARAIAAETPEQREERLRKKRDAHHRRRANVEKANLGVTEDGSLGDIRLASHCRR